MHSIEPGISRFRVWSFGPSRNDDGRAGGWTNMSKTTPCTVEWGLKRLQNFGPSWGLILLRVKQRHRRIHRHLDQADAVVCEAVLERGRQLRRLADAHGVAAHALGDLDEVDVG